jgi:hypothetical protein
MSYRLRAVPDAFKSGKIEPKRFKTMTDHLHINPIAGVAALSICESLLLALIDRAVISEQVAHDLLTDVLAAHTEAAALSSSPEEHEAVVRTVKRMLPGKGPTKLAD